MGPRPTPETHEKTLREQDSYAAPPRHKDSSGVVVRGVILAGLLGLAAFGYSYYASQPRAELIPSEERQVADNAAPPPTGGTFGDHAPETEPTETAPSPARN